MARKGAKAKIDLRELEKLCMLNCTDEECAAFFRGQRPHDRAPQEEPKFAELMARGKAKGRLSLRRMQLRHAERGNSTMLVWLGKNLLGQTDRIERQVEAVNPILRAIVLPKLP